MNNTLAFFIISLIISACNITPKLKELKKLKENEAFVQEMIQNQNSFYYTDINSYPNKRKTLPIGIFDSGIGGLTVMDAIINWRGWH